MREKELRIALVCFGGVSLAVYMHGISKEILKLVRASSALHAIADRTRARAGALLRPVANRTTEYDTEAVYFELLREIGRSVELRVVVDIIAGRFGGRHQRHHAGARLEPRPADGARLRELWLENADVAVLLSADARAGAWSKWFLQPFIWAAAATGRFSLIKDLEVRQKLSLFVRSRWFRPPLDGRVMAGLMYDAVASMGDGRRARSASLLPSGHSLDLFVTVTDFYGYQQLVQIHDPPLIHELEHHHVLHFNYRRHSSGEVESDFDLDNAAGLAFAARATSSFPGAFPPARIVEMDEVVARTAGQLAAAGRVHRQDAFRAHLRAGIDPATASFIDGAVLNNRPFQQAISAIHGRPAYRQVDRRLRLYRSRTRPSPASLAAHRASRASSRPCAARCRTSRAPSRSPTSLPGCVDFNEQVRRLRAIIDSARPHVSELVAKVDHRRRSTGRSRPTSCAAGASR